MKDMDASGIPQIIIRGVLHADGGSRGNPGDSGIGYVLEEEDILSGERELISYGGWFIGRATNNQAEYHALLWGLGNALELLVRNIVILVDSELVAKQLLGEYKVKNAKLQPLFLAAQELLRRFASVEVRHVGRELNNSADELVNAALDARSAVGEYHVEYVSAEGVGLSAAAAPVLPAAADVAQGTLDLGIRPDNDEGSQMMAKQGKYYLTVTEHFDAAHALIGYDGECKNLHGHTWDIDVEVCGTELDVVGIVYDFKDLKENLKEILKQFDHKYLNEVPPFDGFNATAENLARVIYRQIAEMLPAGIEVVEVACWESPIAKLVYREE